MATGTVVADARRTAIEAEPENCPAGIISTPASPNVSVIPLMKRRTQRSSAVGMNSPRSEIATPSVE